MCQCLTILAIVVNKFKGHVYPLSFDSYLRL
jgi:hypothetical protein